MSTALSQLPPAATPSPVRQQHLSRRAKAAIVVRLLLAEGAKISLTSLPESLQTELTEQMGALRIVDRTTLSAVIGEFADELESVGLAFSGGLEGALSVLDGTISPRTAGRMRKEVGMKAISDPWERIAGLDNERLLPILEEESVEITAVVLSKLNVSKSAELLGLIPGPQARRIAYAMSMTGQVVPEAVDRIGVSLASQLDAQPTSAFETDPVERVGAILNFSPANTRDLVLDGLGEDDAEFAKAVRKAIFTFANIPARIYPRDIPKVIRGIDQADLITALNAAKKTDGTEAADFILENMSKRMADTLQEEMGEAGSVKEADGEAAMNRVVGEIRRLESEGEIFLVAEED